MDSMRVQSQRLLLNWKTNNTSSYLRALMHDDGNIKYINYQSKEQLSEYLTNNGLSDSIAEIIS